MARTSGAEIGFGVSSQSGHSIVRSTRSGVLAPEREVETGTCLPEAATLRSGERLAFSFPYACHPRRAAQRSHSDREQPRRSAPGRE